MAVEEVARPAVESKVPLEPLTNPEVWPASSAEVLPSPRHSPPPVPSSPHPSPHLSPRLPRRQSPEEPIDAPSVLEWLLEEPVDMPSAPEQLPEELAGGLCM